MLGTPATPEVDDECWADLRHRPPQCLQLQDKAVDAALEVPKRPPLLGVLAAGGAETLRPGGAGTDRTLGRDPPRLARLSVVDILVLVACGALFRLRALGGLAVVQVAALAPGR